MVRSETPGAWSVKDILAHVTTWEKAFIYWYKTGLTGHKQALPEWSKPGTIDTINIGIYLSNQDRALKDVLEGFKESYKKIYEMVESIPEDLMFAPGKFEWTGKDTLADYIIANTSRHYSEHVTMIEAIKKKLGK